MIAKAATWLQRGKYSCIFRRIPGALSRIFMFSFSPMPAFRSSGIGILLRDGPATYEAMFADIRNAKDHINVEAYIIDDDDVGRQFAGWLLERQTNGIQVNII